MIDSTIRMPPPLRAEAGAGAARRPRRLARRQMPAAPRLLIDRVRGAAEPADDLGAGFRTRALASAMTSGSPRYFPAP